MTDEPKNTNSDSTTSPETPETVDLSVLSELSFGPKWGDPSSKPTRSEGRGEPRKKGFKGKSGDFKRRDRRSFDRKGGRDQRKAQPSRPPRPAFNISFYPEDEPFMVLSKAIRASCKTYELFEIAHLILQKPERFVVVLKPLLKKGEEPKKMYSCPIDGMPFESEEAALAYALKQHISQFFDVEEVEIEGPKGSFPIVNKCGITGELLGPPNYHRYQDLLKQHYENNLHNVSYERFLSKIESVKEDEQINAWVEKMKKAHRYTLKGTPEGVEPTVYETWEEARAYIKAAHKKDLVKAYDQLRFSGHLLASMKPGRIKEAVELQLNNQREFPLDTANNLRGRLRRMKFAIYKKGSKGVSYVCAVKRKFRDENTHLTDSIQKLIEFIEKHSNISISDLPYKYLNISQPEAAEGEEAPKAPEFTEEQQKEVKQLMLDLRWLVSEGYVTEYGNGNLFAPPVMTPQAKEDGKTAETASAETAPTEASEVKPEAEAKVEEPEVTSEPKAEEAPQEETKTEA